MDQQELQKQIAVYYSKLPPASQALFSGMEWLQTLRTISEKYTLSELQIQTLGTETTLVLLGILSLNDYEEILKKELGTVPETTAQIIKEIDDKILLKIRPELAETFEKNSQFPVDGKLDQRFDSLSEKTRNAITESGYYATVYEIAQEFKLNIEEIGELEAVTTDVITGKVGPEKFEDTLKDRIKLPEDKIREMVKTVNEKVLKRIREKLLGPSTPNTPVSLVKLDLPELEMPKHEEEILSQTGIKIIPTTPPKVPDMPRKVEVRPAEPAKKVEVKSMPSGPEIKPDVKPLINFNVPKKVEVKPEIPKTEPAAPQKLSSDIMTRIKPSSGESKSSPSYNIPAAPKIDPYREIPE